MVVHDLLYYYVYVYVYACLHITVHVRYCIFMTYLIDELQIVKITVCNIHNSVLEYSIIKCYTMHYPAWCHMYTRTGIFRGNETEKHSYYQVCENVILRNIFISDSKYTCMVPDTTGMHGRQHPPSLMSLDFQQTYKSNMHPQPRALHYSPNQLRNRHYIPLQHKLPTHKRQSTPYQHQHPPQQHQATSRHQQHTHTKSGCASAAHTCSKFSCKCGTIYTSLTS